MAVSSTKLRVTGHSMPQVGLGLWKIPNESTADAVYSAIVEGYRHFDAACDYGNEKETGQGIQRALKEGIVTREELFITSKLWATFHAPDHVEPALRRQLLDFGLDYFDMYMIHFPIPLQYVDPAERYPPGWSAFTDKWETIPSPTPIAATWNALEKLFDLGIVKNLGVCNFQGTLLLDLLRSARVFPAVLQIEYHPYLVQDKLLALCKEYDIVVTAHSSFGPSGYREIGSQKSVDTPLLLESELITGLASKHEKSPAQILLRWAVQKGVIVIPKSSSAARRKQNLDLFSFELEEKEMTAINSLDRGIRFNDPGDYLNPPQRIFA